MACLALAAHQCSHCCQLMLSCWEQKVARVADSRVCAHAVLRWHHKGGLPGSHQPSSHCQLRPECLGIWAEMQLVSACCALLTSPCSRHLASAFLKPRPQKKQRLSYMIRLSTCKKTQAQTTLALLWLRPSGNQYATQGPPNKTLHPTPAWAQRGHVNQARPPTSLEQLPARAVRAPSWQARTLCTRAMTT